MTNDVMMNFACIDLPFGGVGDSGYGVVKGKEGFAAMSHKRVYCMLANSAMFDLP